MFALNGRGMYEYDKYNESHAEGVISYNQKSLLKHE